MDTPYPGGVIRLNVDATDLAHAIMTSHETIPVAGPGPIVLQLPQWLAYYFEGQLIWLDADTLIREKTGGRKSLDDFAAAFFGVDNGSVVTHTYAFYDVVAALNAVLPYDWTGFLRQRLDGHGPGARPDGVAAG